MPEDKRINRNHKDIGMQQNLPFDITYDFKVAAEHYLKRATGLFDKIGYDLTNAFELAIKKDFKSSAQAFESLVETDERIKLVGLFHAGICHLFCGELCSAATAFCWAKKITPNDYWLHLFEGVTMNLLGLSGRANTSWWTAHIINPNPMINSIIAEHFDNENHPERLALFPICRGSGLDVGCGGSKTHPDAIGIDLAAAGQPGFAACEKNRLSQADTAVSGDNIPFPDLSSDYIVQRHNLEHYQDPIKALQEWYRLLKFGGILGMVIPDERYSDTIKLDPTHKHVFTPESLQRILSLIGGFEIVHMAPLLYHWSFICVAQKIGNASGHSFDYVAAVAEFEKNQIRAKAEDYVRRGLNSLAEQCRIYLDTIFGAGFPDGKRDQLVPVDHSVGICNPTKVNTTCGCEQFEIPPKESSRTTAQPQLYLGLVKGEGYGWGVCSHYLIEELSKLIEVRVLSEKDGSASNPQLKGVLFQALTSGEFFPMFEKARAEKNYAYTFFENELTTNSIKNAKRYGLVFGGSSWCRDRMLEKGITNCEVLIQGIDPQRFYPVEKTEFKDRFMIFSGGKFELRKGQDLVLKAVKILQDKYPDVWLVNCWYNLWPASTRLMTYSKHIQFEHHAGESWQTTMQRTYMQNGLDTSRIITYDLVPQQQQVEIFAQTDIGVFPNRCEGGTNLVLMEYMACGKPVIASNTSGHKDIVNQQNALLLNRLSDFNVVDADGVLIGRWQEPHLDELVAQLEFAYEHQSEIRMQGVAAGRHLKHFTWSHAAQRLLDVLKISC